MKVLVTGASGRLGEFVVRELLDRHELVLMSRQKPAEAFRHLPWVQGDLTNFEECRRAVEGVEAIQHLAAQPWPVDHPDQRGQAAERGIPFDATFKSNMLGTYYLMQAAVEARVRVVVMSGSNCALGHGYRISSTPFPHHFLPINESHPCYPEDSYSYSKLAGEMLLASYSRAYGLRTYVTRPSGICPPARRQQMAQNATPATGWNPWLWCWVGSEDVASAHPLIMEKAEQLPLHDVYYLNADDTTALEPTAELVERFKPELKPLVEGLSGYQSFFSNHKLKQAAGWQHQTSWRELR
jgi:nucleoside-diphosphate-sugar epimerase